MIVRRAYLVANDSDDPTLNEGRIYEKFLGFAAWKLLKTKLPCGGFKIRIENIGKRGLAAD